MNDATPATPVGGNPGTTLGQLRLNAVQRAADIWGGILDSPVEIRIQVRFVSLSCDVQLRRSRQHELDPAPERLHAQRGVPGAGVSQHLVPDGPGEPARGPGPHARQPEHERRRHHDADQLDPGADGLRVRLVLRIRQPARRQGRPDRDAPSRVRSRPRVRYGCRSLDRLRVSVAPGHFRAEHSRYDFRQALARHDERRARNLRHEHRPPRVGGGCRDGHGARRSRRTHPRST